MARIEDYALIGDCETAALVGLDGSIDWLCLPRFDSESCFAKLLGTESNGHWLLAPTHLRSVDRRYLPGTLVLETTFVATMDAFASSTSCRQKLTIRRSSELWKDFAGTIEMRTELVVRFDSRQDRALGQPH